MHCADFPLPVVLPGLQLGGSAHPHQMLFTRLIFKVLIEKKSRFLPLELCNPLHAKFSVL